MPKERMIVSIAKQALRRRQRHAVAWSFAGGCISPLLALIFLT